jgi:hypothetical protein
MGIHGWRSGAVLAALVLGTGLAASAVDEVDEEEAACKEACQVAFEECADACSEHDDPVECDADCRDEHEDCQQRCSE